MHKGKVDLVRYQEEIDIRIDRADDNLSGAQGFCFIEGRKVIKIYNFPKKIEQLYDLSNFKSKKIAFPIFYVYKDKMIYGEVMPYFKGKTIDEAITGRSNINRLMHNYEDIIEEIMLYNNILMMDVEFEKNVLYTPNDGFKIIDTTSWKVYDKNQSEESIRQFNYALFNVLRKLIFNYDYVTKIVSELRENYWCLKGSTIGRELLYLIESNIKGDFHLIELIEAYKEIVRIYYNYDIETVSDIKNYTKLLKKS